MPREEKSENFRTESEMSVFVRFVLPETGTIFAMQVGTVNGGFSCRGGAD